MIFLKILGFILWFIFSGIIGVFGIAFISGNQREFDYLLSNDFLLYGGIGFILFSILSLSSCVALVIYFIIN